MVKITYLGLYLSFGDVLRVIVGSEGRDCEKMEIFEGIVRPKTLLLKSLQSTHSVKFTKE